MADTVLNMNIITPDKTCLSITSAEHSSAVNARNKKYCCR